MTFIVPDAGGVGVGVRAADGWRGRSPEFGRAEETVTVEEGQTAKLPCIVYHLNDRSVTWLRRRDLHILTAGHVTYSADDRFQVVHAEGSEEWTLVVRYAQQRDSAVYECQVNTDPKLSRPVTLNVLSAGRGEVTAPKAPKVFVANNTASTKDGHLRVEIQGARELYIEEGSSLSLTCLVTSSKGPSTPVYWYHDTNLIDYNSPRGGVNLKIDQGRGETTTRLVVSAVGPGDSGMYSCVPPGSHPATVLVHVQKGEHEAAIQQGGLDEAASASSQVASSSLIILLILLIFSTYLLDLLDQFMAHSLPSYTSLSFICFCSTYFLSSLAFSSPRDAVCRWISHLLGRLQHLS
ncbi:zwei Ig domain protein zig-8 [Procambarus clarkii]|uniref:zwei Ig domain protein zig-8 n=1 Tax=Procambarus clarkii TaxID=6728 RepID=UPI0037425731